MRIGMSELIVILIVALFVLGPDKLPVYAKKMGEALAQFRNIQMKLPKTSEKVWQSRCRKHRDRFGKQWNH